MVLFHEHNIAHRDLKPDNILVNMKSINFETKIIDFGFAAKSKEKLQVFCGTPAYMAPEICNKTHYDGQATDTWASGIILYTMLFGQQPFVSATENELYKKIVKGNFKMPTINPENDTFITFPDVTHASIIKDLINDILQVSDKERITAP
jgi:serine/threonine protein kinase